MALSWGAIWLIVGDSGSGKTSFCQRLVAAARQAGADVAGLLCPARLENGQKVGIEVCDLRRSIQRRLGWRYDLPVQPLLADEVVAVGEWLLEMPALEWGGQVLKDALPCDLLVVDELGPLEFLMGKGWQVAFELLDQRNYRLALVTVRESLRQAARQRWQVDHETLLANYPSFEFALEDARSLLNRYL